jgi:hypothetical protein
MLRRTQGGGCGAAEAGVSSPFKGLTEMPEDILYVLEKFLLAVTELATSQRDLRARLADAYMSNFV